MATKPCAHARKYPLGSHGAGLPASLRILAGQEIKSHKAMVISERVQLRRKTLAPSTKPGSRDCCLTRACRTTRSVRGYGASSAMRWSRVKQ